MDDYNFNDTTLTDEVFGNYFNEYLNTSNRYQRDKEEVSSPTLVNEGLAKWTKISEGDVVLDPFAGFCGSLIKISKNNIRTKHSLIAYSGLVPISPYTTPSAASVNFDVLDLSVSGCIKFLYYR